MNENFGMATAAGIAAAAINYYFYVDIVAALVGAFPVGFIISLVLNYAIDGWKAAEKK